MTVTPSNIENGGAAKTTEAVSAAQSDVILRVESLTKTFGALRAVDDVSFEAARGQIFGIAGPNGSGKSTLFNVVSGIPFKPDSGRILFDGQEIAGLPGHRIARLGLVRSFQKDPAFDSLSARQTLRLSAVYSGASARTEPRAIDALLDRFEFVERRRDEPSGTLPIFEKKCLAWASALIMRPKLLLLDEPASGLTKPEVQRLDQLIVDFRAEGVTILVIEHVLPLLLSVSDTLLIMNYGKVIAQGAPLEVIREPQVVEAYLGRRSAA